ncbi:MAG: arsenate reductase ArsC [Deinococcota bacterium]
MRILVLCTHNSARSQMAEGWLRHYINQKSLDQKGLDIVVTSAGTEKTRVKSMAIQVMQEVDIDISKQSSKTLWDVPEPWKFEIVITLCDSAKENCPTYPMKTTMFHVPFVDPSGQPVEMWQRVRDSLGRMCEYLIDVLASGGTLTEFHLRAVALIGVDGLPSRWSG